jgi:demethylmenaquinone methyltransferase/2-methoxy-6-polyprenyl-1,4-benzoquinol methylase
MNSELRNAGGKTAREVREMFAQTAPRYDLLNRILSFGMDGSWRNAAAAEAADTSEGALLVDVCAGSGDLAFALLRRAPTAVVLACDFCRPMLSLGLTKKGRRKVKNIAFVASDAVALPVRSEAADLVSYAFGLRNICADKTGGRLSVLHEAARILRPGGKILVLEFSPPRAGLLAPVLRFWLRHVVPRAARILAPAAASAYAYLAHSIQAYLEPHSFAAELASVGFQNVRWREFCFGLVVLVVAQKPLIRK